ncbi:[FeFe] hydrogenase H-cluster maturation GTPase HydF [Fusobacterium varium]|uniref:[FeFe] hydrogenase H-cluster maturation GTPase HydF n=1 Tax=Fusobacterium varium ATCC 27725 TaxID=469618 RepID=A0ABN5JIC0_FUSVA|nr:[FeFe] hydrogenase H-cluster maturation GTPase HydF [Fusobacterium varium]AVQ31310.1 [FeFe] hydrogenase H-cluster maturation GTPase HydF [Fusobacterium varium ATCC 27725]EES62632.2 hydrogenase maturation GTPase HydF [Fusobacterium varium ATCC 27725]RHG34757.1 [FeFe] hydrogenase H-cluster maturation GTPase HydF [Fusobacterium varium]VEH39971.1 tRNA modification GTPase MnmE [Fusobacterium varium]
MTETPRGNRVHIAIFGRTNAGKSSLINRITNQKISLVSDVKGTTTDPVYKAMELLPIGPVVFIDTAGIDDVSLIGTLRIEKTVEVLDKMDIAIFVVSAETILEDETLSYEQKWIEKIKDKKKPFVAVLNKIDIIDDKENFKNKIVKAEKKLGLNFIQISSENGLNIDILKKEIVEKSPKFIEGEVLIGDKIKAGDKILLVAPQDIQAPKGRLILPQVQVLRDILDFGGIPVMVTLDQLDEALKIFDGKPDLVITDSQVFKNVDEKLDRRVPLTSFSIIMARSKGDLKTLYTGAKRINDLKSGDKVLIAEACTHHQLKGDIAREKIPMLLKKKIPGLIIENSSGKDFPKNLESYSLVIHCGSCMLNRAETMSRIEKCEYITNFGLIIAELNGILDRVVDIFNLKS